MGRSGHALVYLLPSESAYVHYMEISQHVRLQPLSCQGIELPDGKEFIEKIRCMISKEQ